MGRAEDIAFGDERAQEERRRREQDENNRQLGRIVAQIKHLIPRVVAILEEHDFPHNPNIGLDRQIMTVKGEKRAVWYVCTHVWSVGRNPMERYWILSTGDLVDHYGNIFQLPTEHNCGVMEAATYILKGLQRIIDESTPKVVVEEPAPPHKKTLLERWRNKL